MLPTSVRACANRSLLMMNHSYIKRCNGWLLLLRMVGICCSVNFKAEGALFQYLRSNGGQSSKEGAWLSITTAPDDIANKEADRDFGDISGWDQSCFKEWLVHQCWIEQPTKKLYLGATDKGLQELRDLGVKCECRVARAWFLKSIYRRPEYVPRRIRWWLQGWRSMFVKLRWEVRCWNMTFNGLWLSTTTFSKWVTACLSKRVNLCEKQMRWSCMKQWVTMG